MSLISDTDRSSLQPSRIPGASFKNTCSLRARSQSLFPVSDRSGSKNYIFIVCGVNIYEEKYKGSEV